MKKLLNILGLIFDVISLVVFTVLLMLVLIPMAVTHQVLAILVVAGMIFLGMMVMCSYEAIKSAKKL